MTSLPPNPSPSPTGCAGSRVFRRLRQLTAGALLLALAAPFGWAVDHTVAAGGSLSTAVTNAGANDTIIILGQVNSGQITIPSDKNNLTFRSGVDGEPVTIQANAGSRIFSLAQGNTYTFSDIIFRGPGSTSSGGAMVIAGAGDATTTLAGSFTVSGFTGNTGNGAINAVVANNTLVLGSAGGTVTLLNNSGTGGGAAVRGVNITFGGNVVAEGNSATNNAAGAVFANGGTLIVNGNATFRNNSATNTGGAVSATNATFNGSVLFENNLASKLVAPSANNNGGALFINNSATFAGPAIFRNNRSESLNTNGSYGGAIFANLAGNTVSFLGATEFSNNSTSHGNGGAVRANGSLTFAQSLLLSGNSAGRDNAVNAGLSANGGALFVGQELSIAGAVTAANNTAVSSGGAISVAGNSTFGDGAEFTNNTAQTNNGGAISTTANATFGSATFAGNTAGNNGGAIYFGTATGATATTTLRLDASNGNISFQGNTANGNPNAIYLSQGSSVAGVTQRLELAAAPARTISFFDPIASRNAADAAVLVTVEKTGSGTVVFDTHTSNIYADTTIAGGTFQVSNGATYGASNTVGSITVQPGATLSGNGTFRANDLNLATGSRLEVTQGGTLNLNATNRTIASGIALAGHGTLNAGSALESNGIIVNGALVLNDATTLLANRAIATNATVGSLDSAAPLTLAGDTTLDAGPNTSLTILSELNGGTAALTKTGSGTVTLASTNTYSGGTTISAGNLVAVSSGALGSGNVANQGTLTLDNDSNDDLSQTVSGTGNFVKAGSGILTLSGANAYTGSTAITEGTLALNSAAAATGLTTSSVVTLASGATLDLNSHNVTLSSLSGNGGTVALDGADLTVGSAASSTYAGNFTGAAASSITKVGTGTLTLSSAAPLAAGFAGDVAVNAGTLAVTGGALTTTGDFTLSTGATLGLAAGTASITADQVTLQNSSSINIVGYSASTLGAVDLITASAPLAADLGQIALLFEGQAVGAPSLDQYLTLQLQTAAAGTKLQLFSGLAWEATSSAHGTFNVGTGSSFTTPVALADNTTFNSSLAGWNGTTLTKTGAGTLVLGHVNTYTGATAVQEGTLQLGTANAIATSSAVSLAAGTTLDLANNHQTLNNLSGAGTVTLGSATLTANNSANATLSGAISGTGALVKQGAGTLTLSGGNSYTGGTTVSAGSLIATQASALGSGALVNHGSVEFATAGNGSFAGAISGTGTLSKSGSGTLTLIGATGAASTLAVNGGSLALGDGTATHAFTAGSASVAANSALTVDRNSTLAVNGALTLANNSTLNLVVGSASPIVTANTLSIGATGTALNVSGISGNTAMPFTLISTTGGITGAFSAVNVGGSGSSSTDYLQLSALKSANGNDYVLNMALTWLTPGATASGTFTLGQGESFDVGVPLANQAGNANWDGRSITKAGPGTLILSAVNTYTGATQVQAGTLRLGTANAVATSEAVNVAAGATLDLANTNQTLNNLAGAGSLTLGSGTLTAAHSANTTFSGVISGTGSVAKQGSGALTLSGANTYSGGTTINAGRIIAAGGTALGSGTVTLGANGTLEASAGTLANSLSGTGTFLKSGAGLLNYTGNGTAFTGTTTVSAGTLAVNGSLRGTLTVASGGILGGTGSLGNVTISSGGRLAPGNSIGTTTVNGNLTFASGSIYEVEIDPTAADRTNVTGTATIQNGTTVNVTKAAGNYANGTRFTILNAAGGVSGQFSTLTQNLPFLDMFLEYDANNVFLNLSRNTIAFDTYARTRNEQSTARAIESLGSLNALYTGIVALPDEPAVRAAYNAVSGELHATMQTALLDSARLVREAPLRRGAAFGPAASQQPYWAEIVASNGTIDSDGNAAEVDHKTFGVLAGRDFAVGDVTRAGFVVGFTSSTIEPDATPSKLDVSSVHVGVYANTSVEQFSLRGGATASRHTVETLRNVRVGATSEALTTRRTATTAQLFGEAAFLLGERDAGIEPFVGGHLAAIDADSFRELGGTWALRGQSATKANHAALAGLHGYFSGGTRSSFHFGGTVAWQRNFGDLDTTQKLSFTDGNGFSIRGLPLTRQFLVTELNVGLDLAPRTRLTLGYSGRHASEASDHALRGTFTHRF